MELGFKLPTYGQKKKEEEQMMTKAPMMSVASPVKKTQVSQPVASKANVVSGIPTKPMMSYDIEGTILSGVSDDKATKILNYAKKNAKTHEEEKLLIKDMHTEAIRLEQKKMFEKDRTDMKAQIMKDILKETDTAKQKKMGISIKLAEFADTVRDWSISQGIDPNDPDDQSVSTKFIEANPQFETTFTDFVNGKITNVDLGKAIGLIKEEEVVEEDKGNAIKNIVGGAYDSATGLPRFIAQNLAKGVGWIAKQLGADEEKVQGLVDSYIESLKDFSGEAIGADTESGLYKGTKLVGDIAQIANPAGLGKAGVKAGQIAGKVAKEGSLVSKVVKGATQAVADTAIMMPQSEQRLATGKELAVGAVLGGAIPTAGSVYKKGKESIGKLGEKIYAKTIKLNPSQIKKIMKPNIAGVEPERRMLDRKITGNLGQVQSKLDDIAENSYKTLNSKIEGVGGQFKSESGDKILGALKKRVEGIEGLEDVASNIDDMLSKGKEGYTLKDMFSIKRLLDKRIATYSKSGDPIAQETVEGLRNLREKLRKDIDNISASAGLEDVRALSKEIQVATEISNSLENTIAREGKNRAMSLTDLLVGGSLAGGVYAGTGDPRDTIKVVGGALITKKVLENPAVRTKIAVALDKLSPKVKKEISNAIINKSPISQATKNIINKTISQLGVKALKSKEQN